MPEALATPPRAAARERLRGAAVESLGTALPVRSVPNAPIAARLGVADGWIESRTGIRERRVAGDAESLVSLAVGAANEALQRAGCEPAEIDLVIVASFTQDQLLPNAAPLVAHELGATAAGAFDVGSACTGFLAALSLATAQVEAGRADRVLVVGADLVSRALDPDDRRTAALFGDGAGAVLVGPSPAPGQIGPTILRSDGAGARHIRAEREDGLIRMDGHETFKAAVARMSEVTLDAMRAAPLDPGDVDLFVYHQANRRILTAIADRLGLDPARVVDAIGTLGNTSAASLPLALAAADPAPGSRLLLAAFGAGFTWGATTLTWGGADA
jgi:3-oxoacyl-[acyl-carrier-protein] synthase-3